MSTEKKQQVCAVTKEEVLKAIHDFKTTSAKELSEILEAPGADVYVFLGELTQAEISRALGVDPAGKEKVLPVDQSCKFKDKNRFTGPVEPLAESYSEEDEEKICPILNQGRYTGKVNELRPCIGKKCACYIRVSKQAMLTNTVFDSVNIMVYEGCGLVPTLPWQLKRKPN